MIDATGRHPGVADLVRWFDSSHLPGHLQAIVEPCEDLAVRMLEQIADGPELTAGLRKLLESKDCMVRAYIAAPRKQ